MPGVFPNPPPAWGGLVCSECGVNKGQKPDEHVCDQKQFLAHQQAKWAAEIRNKLEPDLQDFLASKRGQFVLYLIEQKRI